MKYLVVLSFLTFAFLEAGAQAVDCPYFKKYIDLGSSLARKKNPEFEKAINAYSNALMHCPSRTQEARDSIIGVFKLINELKEKAEQAEKRATALLKVAENAKAVAQSAYAQADRLVSAFYFYNDRFALAVGGNDPEEPEFYFIDKDANPLEYLGRWNKAEQFDYITGLAKVQQDREDFLLDTFGKRYKLITAIEERSGIDTSIRAIDLRNTNLDSFPLSITKNFPNLEILILGERYLRSNRQFKTLPPQIRNLSNLKFLDLSSCAISTLPAEIGELKDLRYLNLGNNTWLNVLPPEMASLTELRVLILNENDSILALPSFISGMKYLQVMDISDMKLAELPAWMGQLTDLQVLRAGGNNFNHIPSSITRLRDLRVLDLDDTKISALPEQFDNLKNLRQLVLSSTKLEKWPEQLNKLKELTHLVMSYLPLGKIPADIGNFVNLVYLDIAETGLTELPREIGKLKKLYTLDATYNTIEELLGEIGEDRC